MGDRVVGFVPSVKDYNGGFTVFPPVNQSAQSALLIVGDAAADFVLPHVTIHESLVQNIENQVCVGIVPPLGVGFGFKVIAGI